MFRNYVKLLIPFILVLLLIRFIKSEEIINKISELSFKSNDYLNVDDLKQKLFVRYSIDSQKIFASSKQVVDDASEFKRNYDDITCLMELDYLKIGISRAEKPVLQMLDSWGKLPSGILSGNFFEFGSFDQCFSISFDESYDIGAAIRPQYCIGQIVLEERDISWNLDSKAIAKKYLQNHMVDEFGIEGRMGALRPDTSSKALNIGMCIPASCSPAFMENVLNQQLNESIKANISINILSHLCQVDKDFVEFTTLDFVTIAILVTISSLIVASTLYDIISTHNDNQKRPIFMVFSIWTNGKKLFTCKRSKSLDMMDCLHGIRAISAAWIVYGHTYFMYMILPTKNMASYLTWISQYHSMFVMSAVIAVDTFFFLSGLLVTLSVLKQFEKSKGRLNVAMVYFHRFLRLTPLLVITVLFCCSLLKFLGNGPFWPFVMNYLRDQCERNWLPTLLYIQNYWNPKDICIGYTWYLSVDMQLFICAPPLIYFLYKYQKNFLAILILLVFICMGCTIATFLLADPIKFKEITERMALVYFPTHIRMSPWLIGIIFGYFMFHARDKKIVLSKSVNMMGWIVSMCALNAVIFANYPLQQPNYDTTIIQSALYDSMSRVIWSLALCYIIFACVHNYGGPINWFLSLKEWQPVSRLSYAIYLLHSPVLLVTTASLKSPLEFYEASTLQSFVGAYGITIAVSVIASLAFESPIVAFEKILFGRHQKSNKLSISSPVPVSVPVPNTSNAVETA